MRTIANSLRLCALFAHSIHEVFGTSQAFCTPMMKLADSLRRCAPPPHENWGTSQALCSPMMKMVDSRRLWAVSVLSIHQNWGTSQALWTPMMKIADSLRLCAPPSRKLWDVSGSVHPHNERCRLSQALSTPPHGNWGTSQAVCTPIIKSPTASGSGHFLCTPRPKMAGRLRRRACP